MWNLRWFIVLGVAWHCKWPWIGGRMWGVGDRDSTHSGFNNHAISHTLFNYEIQLKEGNLHLPAKRYTAVNNFVAVWCKKDFWIMIWHRFSNRKRLSQLVCVTEPRARLPERRLGGQRSKLNQRRNAGEIHSISFWFPWALLHAPV